MSDRPSPAARISLCLIVRDEEALLRGCLASAADHVDEIIVVDTGSEDGTVAIARSFGAAVHEFAWVDDFAAARNEALRHASGAWILVLDADERLADGAGPAIRQAVQRGDFDCGYLPIHNAATVEAPLAEVVDGTARRGSPALIPRLLRHTPELAWNGRVHEAVDTWLEATSGQRRRIAADIVHLGAVPEQRATRRKCERNLALLRRRCAEEPDEPTWLLHLAAEYRHSGDTKAAGRTVERAVDAARRAAQQRGGMPTFTYLANLVADDALARGDHASALAFIEEVRGWGGDHPNLDFAHGLVLGEMAACATDPTQMERRARASVPHLERALERHGGLSNEETLFGVTSWKPRLYLGEARLLLADADDAKREFELGQQSLEPHLTGGVAPEALVVDQLRLGNGIAEALLEEGLPGPALATLEAALGDRNRDGWVLAAAICEELGKLNDMGRFLAQARQLSTGGQTHILRTARLGRRMDELRCAASIYAGQPRPGVGAVGLLGALLSDQPPEEPSWEGWPASSSRFARLARNLIRIQNFAAVEGMLSHRAEAWIPGIQKIVSDEIRRLEPTQ